MKPLNALETDAELKKLPADKGPDLSSAPTALYDITIL